jgi:hypothetical protein
MVLRETLTRLQDPMGNSVKKKIRLMEEHVKVLSELPESGMGYQIVDIFLKDGKRLKNRIVLNSEFIIVDDNESIDPDTIEKVELVKR